MQRLRHKRDDPRWPGSAMVRFVFALPIIQLAVIVWLIWDRSFAAPWQDEWALVNLVERAQEGTLRFSYLWSFHNGHRIVVPRLIALLLIEWSDWDRRVLASANIVCALGTAALLVLSTRRSLRSPRVGPVVAAAVPVLVLSLAQVESWVLPFTINLLATTFGLALCIWAIGVPRAGWRRLVVGIGGALVASLSSAAGLLVWVAASPLLWRLGRWKAAVWAGVAVAVIIPYLQGFTSRPGAGKLAASGPREVLVYAISFLGAPIGYDVLPLAFLFGLLGLVLVPANLVVFWRHGENGASDVLPVLPWVTLALFALGAAAVTALGRGGNVSGARQALATRYHTFSALWWVAMVLIGVLAMSRLVGSPTPPGDRRVAFMRRALVGANGAVLGAAVVCFVVANVIAVRDATTWLASARRDESCVFNYRTAADQCLARFHHNPNIVRNRAPYLEEHHLAIFDERHAAMIGSPGDEGP